mmetsp:Transcript_13100/g.15822  ORF Transcript_13100/g.15822 Transcript_13100/m.15822 type:complete len:302 (-) Transcript_13100:366-1271(-)|eukprot:CAMPEP_0197843284 /NCGR_PEP_ID=MMETSP1438-20131217/120_1 /TAXON_ID=1461541 /ORGANISM="Pterosperma sp., Strain CCMP1384" /LENGTH=301 /DNA_ID=CAMNT_0043453315 /DNA_START=297 /DNA_END=1202 /DNA_ORIENTATION=+
MSAMEKPKRSMFGKQHDSRKETAPAFGFGSSDRNGATKVFVTAEHAKSSYGKESPGPVYELKSSLGKQESSKNESSPLFSFGTADRFAKPAGSVPTRYSVPGPGAYQATSSIGKQGDSTRQSAEAYGFGSSTRVHQQKVFLSPEHAKTNYGEASPGPSVYNAKSAVGKQPDSKKDTAPSWVFSSEERFKYDYVERAAKVPGAGQYNSIGAVGSQADSKKQSLPKYSFGSSQREQRSKVYISPDHEKSSYGHNSPGPASVGGKSALGKQCSSKNPTGSSWSFGSAKRFVYNESRTPGPGNYD